MSRLIDADALSARMYHDAFETDSDMKKWDSGCWIRYKMFEKNLEDAPTIEQPRWIPCSERLPEEDHWLGGSGRQFSDEVLVSVANYDDEDIWTAISQTIDGEWVLELPSHCKIVAWMPLPDPYREEE